MNRDLEAQIRAALVRVEPPEGFTERVMKRIKPAPATRRRTFAMRQILAVAAVLLLLLSGYWMRRATHAAAAARSEQQVIYALRLTSQKLAVVHRQLKRSSLRGEPASGRETREDL